jgi:hypothetical protein
MVKLDFASTAEEIREFCSTAREYRSDLVKAEDVCIYALSQYFSSPQSYSDFKRDLSILTGVCTPLIEEADEALEAYNSFLQSHPDFGAIQHLDSALRNSNILDRVLSTHISFLSDVRAYFIEERPNPHPTLKLLVQHLYDAHLKLLFLNRTHSSFNHDFVFFKSVVERYEVV